MSSLLTNAEKQSSLWLKLKAHFEARLDEARRKNDGNLTADETAKQRGKIAEIKATLALGETPAPIEVEVPPLD